MLRVDPDNRLIHRLFTRVISVTPKQLAAASVGTFVYAALLLTEGTGLLLRKRWAEYFTIVSTAGLIPLEVYEIQRHMTAAKIFILQCSDRHLPDGARSAHTRRPGVKIDISFQGVP